MRETTGATRGVVDVRASSDARLAAGVVAAAVVGFAVLVLLPYAAAGFAPPAGTDVVWRVGGPLAVVLAPIAAGLAAAASCAALWGGARLDATARRLHLTALLAASAFMAFLVSAPGRAVLAWWQD